MLPSVVECRRWSCSDEEQRRARLTPKVTVTPESEPQLECQSNAPGRVGVAFYKLPRIAHAHMEVSIPADDVN